nr:unnamed protein product [Callosobruchus chinensis]
MPENCEHQDFESNRDYILHSTWHKVLQRRLSSNWMQQIHIFSETKMPRI